METSKDKRRAIFLVSKCRTKSHGAQSRQPGARIPNFDFPFELLFVAGCTGPTRSQCNWGFAGEHSDGPSGADWGCRSGSLDAKPEKASTAAQVGIGRVKKRILLENAPSRDGPERVQAEEDVAEIRDGEFHFNFAMCRMATRHG